MKKQNYEQLFFLQSRRKREERKRLREKSFQENRDALKNKDRKQITEKHSLILRRERFRKKLYRSYKYTDGHKNIIIDGQFGIEEPELIEGFLKKSSEIIDFETKSLSIDLENCTRVWPSAITLLCSLKQWTELCNSKKISAQISSSSSKHVDVTGYLDHCGFHEYVERPKDSILVKYNEDEIVKIKREKSKYNIEPRENEILRLLELYGKFDTVNGLEDFNSRVLTEVFLNITEHGVSNIGCGWWLLAQYHPTHKIISLCIADNGIGFRNSLVTGPQQGEILGKILNVPENEGEFLKLAMESNVSGAVHASVPEGFIFKKYERGARRGNGLKRVHSTCSRLGIKLSILSHNGYIFFDESGSLIKYGGLKKRVFAGTLYHFNIKAK